LNDWNSAADREPWIVVDLMKRQKLSKADALIRYTAMTYNEKQAYAMTMTEPTFIHFGPELSRVGEQLTKGRDRESARQWLFAWLKDPKQYHADTLMPNLRLSDQEASDLAAYLIEQKAAPGVERGTGALTSNPRSFSEKIALGAKLISHYGCMNCHEIGGPPLTQPALDLSNWGQKPLDQLDFTRLDASHRTRQDWLIQHLNNPASVSTADAYDQPRMPFFHLTLEQAQNLAVFVLGNREVDGAIEAGKKSLARGRALTVLHNCVGCHQVETNTPLIQQYFKPGWISTFAPPQLRGEGNRVQYAWLRNFFTHVTPLRPLLGVRMPTFNFRPEEPEDLISFFHAASDKESADLRRMIVLGQTPNLDDWALLHKLAVPIDLNPAYSNRAQIEETQRNVQFEAEFTANLYDTAFLEKELPTSISEDRFKLGERFLQTAQCLACHLMSGDGSGDLTKAKAPNLDLTAERLQKKWVKALLEAPEVVLHGTNMPRYFTGEAGIASNSAVRAAMQLFGKSAQEQTSLLIDFLYAAGPRHYATVADPHLNAFH
jgi:cytochrome c553